MSIKLRDLIRQVRACKTASEERAVIAKESALIRTAFKDQDRQYRHRNVAKLLFIHMLGYPSHFGQMECLKLIASPLFHEKRIGYLGLMLLITDQEEVLTLVTNSLKNDLNHSNPFVVGLSLTAVGNLASADIARDLVSDIDKLLRSDNEHIRKKAALAAVRVFQKVPELVEDLVDSIKSLLKSRNHAVLLTGTELITKIIIIDRENLKYFDTLVPTLVRELRNLLSMGYSSEYDVHGIADPFLQVSILRLLRYLGKGNDEASDAMNDVLAQVATNTETSKNAGNAILYECVRTIIMIQSDNGLKVLAINILGRFLLNRDNNIRYVALNTLSTVINDDAAAVQRHRNTIVDCLKDPDASIRQRALELIYSLVNENNIQSLAREMLNYLVVAPAEQKADLCSNISDAVDRYAPSCRWHIDTLITMLSIAGANLPDERISSSLIILIQRNPDLHLYVVHKLYWALVNDISQLGLVHVGVWSIGEYGQMLLQEPPSDEETLSEKTRVKEGDVIDLLKKVLKYHASTEVTKSYCLTALVKLTTRFQDPTQIARINEVISSYKSSMAVELQQRSCEYSKIMSTKWDSLRPDILAAMPPIDPSKVISREKGMISSTKTDLIDTSSDDAPESSSDQLKPSTSNNLLDLDDIFGTNQATSSSTSNFDPATEKKDSADLLADIFSNGGSSVSSSQPPAAPVSNSNGSGGDDLLGLMGYSQSEQSQEKKELLRAYEKNGLVIDLDVSKPNSDDPSVTYIQAHFHNGNSSSIEKFVFQTAFPKYIKLKLEPPSSNVLPPNNGGDVTQLVKIQNTLQGQKPVMMRVKLDYEINGSKVEDIATVNSFPSNL